MASSAHGKRMLCGCDLARKRRHDMGYWLAGCFILAVAVMFVVLRAAAARADRRREKRNFETESLLHSIGPVEFEASATHAPDIETEPMALTPAQTEPAKRRLRSSRP
jgi:hypothetical protein